MGLESTLLLALHVQVLFWLCIVKGEEAIIHDLILWVGIRVVGIRLLVVGRVIAATLQILVRRMLADALLGLQGIVLEQNFLELMGRVEIGTLVLPRKNKKRRINFYPALATCFFVYIRDKGWFHGLGF